jgi:mxaJ protein
MSSASKWAIAWMLAIAAAGRMAAAPLRICADPNNLPYSNEQQQGFENRIAGLIAKDLGMDVTWFWFPQRGKFFEQTLNRGVCDAVMGVPSGMDDAATTRPYYRSGYVFVTRKDRHLTISSFDDPRLRTLKIGVHILGDQDDSLPPVHAFTSRGIVRNLVGFSIFGNLNEKNPPSDLIRAVEDGKVDVAVAWGPMAGYFARQSKVPLELTAVELDCEHPQLPFAFDIAIGVRVGNTELEQKLDGELMRRHAEIEQILRSYGVPLLSMKPPQVRAPQEARSTED